MRARSAVAGALLLLATSVGCDGSLTRDLIVRYQSDERPTATGEDVVLEPRPLPAVVGTIDSIAATHQMTRIDSGSVGGLPAWGKPVLLGGRAGSDLSIEINLRSADELRIRVALWLAGRESPEMTSLIRELTVALHARPD